MKKKLACISLTTLMFFTFALNGFAIIKSINEIDTKIKSVNKISTYDFNKFVNKSELIGEKKQNFSMATAQYQNSLLSIQNSLHGIVNQINVIKEAEDVPDIEKKLQINKLYMEADSSLYEINSKSIQYLSSLQSLMPSLTYQKFAKKFKVFYNSLDISGSKLE